MPVCCALSSNRTDAILSATFLPPAEEAAYIPSPRHVPLHHKSATPDYSPFRAVRIYRLRPMAMSGLLTPPGVWRLPSLRTLPPSVDCVLSIGSPKHFWPRLRCSPLRLKTASAFGSIDCSLRLHSASSMPPSLCSGGMALHYVCARKLSSHFHSHFTPDTSGYVYGVGYVPIPVCPETSACYSGPSMSCRRSPSCGRREPSISAHLPPIEESDIVIQSVGFLSFIVCDAMPTPGPDARCADALTTLRQSANHSALSESAYGLGQGQVGLLSAVQAPRQKACRSVPTRHLPFALILM